MGPPDRTVGVVGARIRYVREALGFTQTELGAQVDVNQGTVSDWETGKVEVPRGQLRLVADLAKDSLRVFRYLVAGGPTPRIVPFSSLGPSDIEALYAQASITLHAASKEIEGVPYVPMYLVSQWLTRLYDAAAGFVEPGESGSP